MTDADNEDLELISEESAIDKTADTFDVTSQPERHAPSRPTIGKYYIIIAEIKLKNLRN